MDLPGLQNKLNEYNINFEVNKPLKGFTTYKIGGPADIFAVATSKQSLIQLITAAKETDTPFTVIGWGSNVLITDKGIRGLVIKNNANRIDVLDEQTKSPTATKVEARLTQVEKNTYYNFDDLDYSEQGSTKVKVVIESGASLPLSIMNLIRQGITGLQWFGGIPGTIGGAVYNNIHGGNHFISEYIESVEVLNPKTLKIEVISNKDCKFGYDESRFHTSGEIILSANLVLNRGDAERAKETYTEWTRRKKKQPQISAGCMWKNISETQRKKLNLESTSWGYIIDKVLHLKGKKIGGAQISNQHAAFIENIDNAKAEDVIALMEAVTEASTSKLGIAPETEIFIIGER